MYSFKIISYTFYIDKIRKAKKVSKAWSEKDESSGDSDNNETLTKSPKQPSPKKRKLVTKNYNLNKNPGKNILLPKPPNSAVKMKCEYIVYTYLILYCFILYIFFKYYFILNSCWSS